LASALDQFKDLFNKLNQFNNKNLLGVDIGSNSIKMCELSNPKPDVLKLESFSVIPLSEACLIEDEIQKRDEMVEKLRDCHLELETQTTSCNLGIFGPNTVSKRMYVGGDDKDEIEDNIMWESEQFISFGVDDAQVKTQIIRDNPDSDDSVDAIMCAAHMDTIQEYQSVLKEAGLNTKIVDLDVIALNNIVEYTILGNLEKISEEGVYVFDFGAQSTRVVVYKDGGPKLSREIPIGGVVITEEIQRQMGLGYEEAEDLKCSGELPEEVMTIIEQVQGQILEEVKKTLNFFISGSNEQILNCVIMGGNSKIPGLVESLEAILGVEVNEFRPMDYIVYDKKKFKEEDIEMINALGGISLGLSLRSAYP
jgi:type IV pilus assembly protein PilM